MNPVTLVVEKGRLETREFDLSRDSTTIGSAPINDICLTDDATVARVHAEIRRRGVDEFVITPMAKDGTRVNGKVITAATPLLVGDRVAIGRGCVFRVDTAGAPGGTAKGAAIDTAVASSGKGLKIPTWVIGYLVLIAATFGYFIVSGSSDGESLTAVTTKEIAYATQRHLGQDETAHVVQLLTLGAAYERQGKYQTAYEVYRDVLGARTPAQPHSPAYVFAAGRMVAVSRR